MGKISMIFIGGVIGAVAGMTINYLFGPTSNAEFTANYRSRWDRALEEGKQAAAERELELRRQLIASRRPQSQLPG